MTWIGGSRGAPASPPLFQCLFPSYDVPYLHVAVELDGNGRAAAL
jgi:hypothetical protein